MPRNETPAKFIKKEKGPKDGVKERAKNEQESEGGKKAVKSGTLRGPKSCLSDSFC